MTSGLHPCKRKYVLLFAVHTQHDALQHDRAFQAAASFGVLSPSTIGRIWRKFDLKSQPILQRHFVIMLAQK